MPSAPVAAKNQRRWRVALIHSDATDDASSPASLRACLYLALCLQATDMAEPTLVSIRKHKESTSRLTFLSPNTGRTASAKETIESADMKDLMTLNPDLIIFALNPGDLPEYAELFAKLLTDAKTKKALVFNLLRGVQEEFVMSDK